MNDDRRLAVGLFDEVWALLETADRTPEQDERMIHAAHCSRLPDWIRAEAHEALARGHLVAGETGDATRHAEEARAIAATIEDQDDREVVLGDLATLPFE